MGDLMVLSSPGIASIITLRSSAAKTLKVVKDDQSCDDINRSITTIAKQIQRECKTLINDKAHYNTNIDKQQAAESVPETGHAL